MLLSPFLHPTLGHTAPLDCLGHIIHLLSKPIKHATPTKQTKVTKRKKNWHYTEPWLRWQTRNSQCKRRIGRGQASSPPSTATNCQTSYTEIYKWALGVLLNFNYAFLLETIQNFYINIHIQPVYSNTYFTELKTPKDVCLRQILELWMQWVNDVNGRASTTPISPSIT